MMVQASFVQLSILVAMHRLGATGERKSWLDADPDEPPGPGVISVVRNWVFCGSKMIGSPWG